MAFTRTVVTFTGDITAGSNQITNVSSIAGIRAASSVFGTGLNPDTLVSAAAGTTVTMTRPSPTTATGVTFNQYYIDQTGTDADLSGLNGVGGVTYKTSGSGQGRRIEIDLGQNSLWVNGTITLWDPDIFEVVSDLQCGFNFVAGSNVNYGLERTVNGRTNYSKAVGLSSTYSGDFFQLFGLRFVAGTFNWYGGVIKTSGPISHQGGSIFTTHSYDAVWQLNNTSAQFRSTGTPTFNKFTVQGIGVDAVFFLVGGWNTFTVNYERLYYQTPAGGGANRTILNPVFSANQAVNDIVTNQAAGTQQVTTIKNPDIFPRLGKLSNNAYADFPVTETLSLTITDEDNVSAPNVVAYVRDTNNGARKNSLVTNYVDDRVYRAESTVGGVASLGDIITLVGVHNNLTDGTINLDYRSNYGNTSADFDIHLWGYDFLYAKTRQTLLGNNGKSVLWTMFEDKNKTLSRTAALALLGTEYSIDPATQTITVLANSTYDRYYDALKAYKATNAQVNLETPAIDRLLVVPDNAALTTEPGWTVVVNAGVTWTEGTKFKYVYADTVTNNGTIDGVYGVPAGNQTIWEFNTVEAGSSLAVWDTATNTLLYYQNNVTAGNYRFYIAPGTTGTYGYAIEKLGNLREFGTFPADVGQIIFYKPDNVQDITVVETNPATVAAYTYLNTAVTVNDFEAYWRTTSAGIVYNDTLTRNGDTLNWTPYDVQIDPTAATQYSLAGNQIVVKAQNLVANTVTTTGVVSFANGGGITGIVTDVNGVSTLLQITNLTGCSVAVIDDNGDIYDFQQNQTGTYSIVIPAGTLGTWKYVVTKFGKKYQAGTFALGQGVPVVVNYTEIIDERVVAASAAAVQAYTELETTQKMYDYWSYWVTTLQGIEWYETVTWNGDVLDTDGADLDIDPLAVDLATLEPITNKVIIRATNLSGDLRTDGVVTRLNSATTSGLVTDATGTTSIITFVGFTGTNKLYVEDELDVQRLFSTVTTNERVLYLLPSEQTAGLWTYAAKKTGYEHAVGQFSVAGGGRVTVQIGMNLIKQPNGQAMYTGSATPTDLSVDWTTSGDGTPRIKLGDQAYNVIEIYDEVDRQMSSLDGLKWLAAGYGDVRIATLPAGNFLFLTTGWRLMENQVGDTNAALNAFAISEDAQVIDDSNGPVSLISSTSALADDDLAKLRQTWQWLNELTLNGTTNSYANFKRIHDFSFISSQNHQQTRP